MKISTKGKYAMEIVIDLALYSDRDHLQSLKEIADRRCLSEKYLERIVKMLRKNGIILSMRGAGGGYCLSRPAEKITALEVLKASEGELEPVRCLTGPSDCGMDCTKCPTREEWKEMWDIIKETAEQLSIAELAFAAASEKTAEKSV